MATETPAENSSFEGVPLFADFAMSDSNGNDDFELGTDGFVFSGPDGNMRTENGLFTVGTEPLIFYLKMHYNQ